MVAGSGGGGAGGGAIMSLYIKKLNKKEIDPMDKAICEFFKKHFKR